MPTPPKLGEAVTAIRNEYGLSLLAINRAGGPDPSYINRVEHGKVNPRAENVAKLARAIASAKNLPLAELWKVMDQLFEAADFVAPKRPDEPVIRRKFRELLRARKLDDEHIETTMAQVSVVNMLRVLEGDEPLEICSIYEFPVGSKHRQTIILPDAKHAFPAGPRATLQVTGEIPPGKREQLKILARLIEKIIAE